MQEFINNLKILNTPILIYIEGLPSAGKTSIINLLREKLEDTEFIGEYINSEKAEKAFFTRDQKFFSKNDEHKYNQAIRSSNKRVIVDRGHLSTVIYSLAKLIFRKDLTQGTILDWYINTILKKDMLPDKYIFLKVSAETSLKRKPQMSLDGDHMWSDHKALKFAENAYIELHNNYERAIPFHIIDTDRLSLDEVLNRILKIL